MIHFDPKKSEKRQQAQILPTSDCEENLLPIKTELMRNTLWRNHVTIGHLKRLMLLNIPPIDSLPNPDIPLTKLANKNVPSTPTQKMLQRRRQKLSHANCEQIIRHLVD
jgi:hypothetical protein